MFETKEWWKSKGVWGSLVVILSSAAGLLGYVVTPEEQAAAIDMAGHGVDLGHRAFELGVEVAAFFGGLVAFWGRITAKSAIGKS